MGPLLESVSDFTKVEGVQQYQGANKNISPIKEYPSHEDSQNESKYLNVSNFMKDFQELKERKEALLRSRALMQSNTSALDNYDINN